MNILGKQNIGRMDRHKKIVFWKQNTDLGCRVKIYSDFSF